MTAARSLLAWIILLAGLVLLTAGQCSGPPDPPLPSMPNTPAVQVALLSPDAGELATFGRRLRNGVVMAFDSWNLRPDAAFHIRWRNFATDCTYESGRQAAQKAVAGGFSLLIGPLCTDAAIAAAETAQAAGVLLVVPTGTHPLVTVDPQGQVRPTVFRAVPVDEAQAQAAARFAVERLRLTRVAVLTDPTDDYSRRLTAVFADRLAALGGEVVYRADYSSAEADFVDLPLALARAGAQAVYLPAPPEVANRLATQLNESLPSTERPLLLGSDRWQSDQLDREALDGSCFSVYFDRRTPSPSTQTWTETYKASFAIEPDTLAAQGYDAATLLLAGLEAAFPNTAPDVLASRLKTLTVDGVTGQISFDARHNAVRPIPFVSIINSQFSMTSQEIGD